MSTKEKEVARVDGKADSSDSPTASTVPADSVACPYCGELAAFVTGTVIYPHRPDLSRRMFYHCLPCDAYVGVHSGTTRPFGRLADANLRRLRNRAHAAFDPVWKGGPLRRGAAYRWLAERLGVPAHECHIGGFDGPMCERVVRLMNDTKEIEVIERLWEREATK